MGWSMDMAAWVMVGVAVLLGGAAIWWWRRRAMTAAKAAAVIAPKGPRDKRRGPRRVKSSRRESFRMGKEDNDRRSGDDRRNRKPGWDGDAGKR